RLECPALGDAIPLCPGERFVAQPIVAVCTGFLVPPDLVATAGHCVDLDYPCDQLAFVFGFEMLAARTPARASPPSPLYYCAAVTGRELALGGPDWAILLLARDVEGRQPLPLRQDGQVPDGDPLLLSGHPLGLPLKLAGGARVWDNTAHSFFTTDVDAS